MRFDGKVSGRSNLKPEDWANELKRTSILVSMKMKDNFLYVFCSVSDTTRIFNCFARNLLINIVQQQQFSYASMKGISTWASLFTLLL